MNWKTHIEQISHKLNTACFTIRNLTHTLNADILRMVYFAYFQPVLQYGIILGGNSAHAQQVFKLQKRAVRIMSGTGPINILPVPCQYILSLMLFIIDKQQDFFTRSRHWKQKSFISACSKPYLCSKRSLMLWGQNL
jgi:hypothetical protein